IYRAISPRYDYDYLTFKERIGLPYLITVINTQKGSRLNIDLNFKYYYDNVYVYDTAVISYISTSNYLPQMTISHYSYYNFDSANVPYKIRVQSANLQNDNYEPDTSDVALAPMYTWQDTGMIRIINKSNDIDWVRIDIPDGYSAKLHIKNYSGSDIIWSCRDTLPYSYSTNNSVYAGSSDSVSLYSSRSYILSMYKYQFSGDSLSSCLVRCKVAKVPQ
ncbi:MAG: hypothetical protein JNL74_21585, partial [Fibrobacteres bacterium]|nr:hypothetical protein [Fibrobacterota bacterium]